MPKDRYSRHARRDLFEQLQPFPADTVLREGKTGGVAARPREARDEATADRVRDQHEYDRYGLGCLLQCPHIDASSQDNVRRQSGQIRRVFASFRIAFRPASVDLHVAAVGPAQLLQPTQECRDAGLPFRIVRARGHEHANPPHPLGPLRVRDERPRRRATKRGYEFSPPDVDCHATLPRGSCNGEDDITPGCAALRYFKPTYIGSGSPLPPATDMPRQGFWVGRGILACPSPRAGAGREAGGKGIPGA